MNGRLFLLAHLSQKYEWDVLEKKYASIELDNFEKFYLNELILRNQKRVGSEWNRYEHHYLKLLYKKMKYQFSLEYSLEYNTYDLISHFETYIEYHSSIQGVIQDIERYC